MTTSDCPELISVILPVYNGEKTIEESVSSVLGQTYKNIELIIVDDASEDSTPEKLRVISGRDTRIRLISNKNNCGRLSSRCKAVDSAEGEWIAFIDADDLWYPEKIEKQIALRDLTGCDLVYTASAFIDENGNKYKWIMHVPHKVNYRRLLKQNVISNSSVMVRKKDFVKFTPGVKGKNDMHEDFACWLSMLKAGLVACGIDEPLITYRISKESGSGNKTRASALNINTYKCIGLGFFERCFYQACYAFNGLRKYMHLNKRNIVS